MGNNKKQKKDKHFSDLLIRLEGHLSLIYPNENIDELSSRCVNLMGLDQVRNKPRWHKNKWNQKDIALITYANSIVKENEIPLVTLQNFLESNLNSCITWLHILPFFPYSSDDGFAVIDYQKVNESYGDWNHVSSLGSKFKLMADLVINHCSGMSQWFEQLKSDKAPGKDYFIDVSDEFDFNEVVRPRTNPIVREVQTLNGIRKVWCTFSHDQPDLEFRNPDVLLEMIKIIRYYLDRGVRIFRLDAVAFLWKESGTTCLNLNQTHEIVRLLRTLMEYYKPDAILITETNIPNQENLSYFGNANEAHLVYNFSLPPLLLHTLFTGNCHAIKSWMMGMPPAQKGTTFFNFIASHDGIGLRPLEGLIDEESLNHMIGAMEAYGGRISWRSLGEKTKPYEINISLFDAFKGTLENGVDNHQFDRFILAHAIMLAVEGVPAFYIHSLLGTENDQEKFIHTNNNRALNRHNWKLEILEEKLDNATHHKKILSQLKVLIEIRKLQKAFHPNAIQFTLHVGDHVFAFMRQSTRRDQCIFCLYNVTSEKQTVTLNALNLIITEEWQDLISGEMVSVGQKELVLKPYQPVWLSNINN